MDIVLYIINFMMGLGMLSLMVTAHFMFRNNKVYNVRYRIINERYELYKFLPSYDDMLYSFSSMNYEYWVNYCEDREFEQS